ncbi:MAG TPA: envelope stress response membrane protein PspC [Sphingomicrobium sp.]|jgi:phage shock protein C|nr:envelope stress response membrane protein PspC [Sphingomicrobium sp.]
MAQPPSRTRFYRNKRAGKINGICAGIADYTGLDVTLVRIGLILAIVLGAGALLPVYFIAGWIADDQPREIAADDKDERKFWQGVRASPSQSARDIRGRMREIDRRLAEIEQYVTTENRSLAREIEQLR